VTVAVAGSDGALNNAAGQGTFAIVWPRFQQVTTWPPSVTWSIVTGINYQVQARTNLSGGAWTLLTTTNPASGTNAVYRDSAATSSQRFYRVIVPR
jgi:hypothetical protein